MYIGFRFFEEYLKQDLPVFWQALRHMLSPFYTPDLRVEAPRVVEAVYSQIGSEVRVALISCVAGRPAGEGGFQNTGWRGFNNIVEIIPIHDIRIKYRSGKIRRATDLAGRSLRVTRADGETAVTVPRLEQYDVISLALG